MKLACVVHRYGPDIAGGSEAHCRQLAERLAARHDVTVLTTRARDYVTWANAYPEGRATLNGVTVIRFPVKRPRRLKVFADLSDEVFETRSSPERQEAWFRENGPDAPQLLEYLRSHGREYDLILFWSYRYYNTYFGDPTNLAAQPIYVEIQPTGWLLDGGVPLWLCYGGAILAAFATAWRLATQRFSPAMADIASLVLPVLLAIVGMGLAGPIFNTQVGILFWFLVGSLYGAGNALVRRRAHGIVDAHGPIAALLDQR